MPELSIEQKEVLREVRLKVREAEFDGDIDEDACAVVEKILDNVAEDYLQAL